VAQSVRQRIDMLKRPGIADSRTNREHAKKVRATVVKLEKLLASAPPHFNLALFMDVPPSVAEGSQDPDDVPTKVITYPSVI